MQGLMMQVRLIGEDTFEVYYQGADTIRYNRDTPIITVACRLGIGENRDAVTRLSDLTMQCWKTKGLVYTRV